MKQLNIARLRSVLRGTTHFNLMSLRFPLLEWNQLGGSYFLTSPKVQLYVVHYTAR